MSTRLSDRTTTDPVVRGNLVVTMAVTMDAAAYGGQEVYREDLTKTELADRNWTITIPPDATDAAQGGMIDRDES